jgi:hypothetical protein
VLNSLTSYIHLSISEVLYAADLNIQASVLVSHGSLNEFGNVQDLQGYLISSYIGIHCSNALLAGGDDRLGSGGHDFVDFLSGNFGGKPGIDHFQVAAATTSAVFTILPSNGSWTKTISPA